MDTGFKIWNFGTPGLTGSGMSVSSDNPAIEIRDYGDDEDDSDGTISLKYMALNDAGKTYVLVSNITLAAGWIPVGRDDDEDPANGITDPFQGKFYGNGHTVTVSGDPADAPYTGVFGYAGGAEIRDLDVEYTGTVISESANRSVGGIVGYAAGNTNISGCCSKTEVFEQLYYQLPLHRNPECYRSSRSKRGLHVYRRHSRFFRRGQRHTKQLRRP
jgi:hypothetical protein